VECQEKPRGSIVFQNRRESMKRQISLARVILHVLAVLALMFAVQVTATGCASGTSGGFSSGGRGAPPPGPSVYEIITQLELEPGQLPAVRSVLEAAEDEREEIFQSVQSGAGSRPDPSTMDTVRARAADLNDRTEARLSELLTFEQMSEYRAVMRRAELMQQQMRSQMDGGRGGPGGGRRGGGKG
jgi:hypothetical protein